MRDKYPHYITKTKKEHICWACGVIIKKGTKNIRYKNVFTGERIYFCEKCSK